ncbi:MAG: hypothetical protein MJY71_06950 [Bacteroidaceae bacterium]|nr:hypothetical protein [Bacteroidaceae bacterium]
MKVLIACNINSYINPYVNTLYEGLIRTGLDVTCSISEFWNNAIIYDIVHLQWPNLLVDNTDPDCKKLQRVIQAIHSAGHILMCTCHNIHPHYDSGIAINKTYQLIYENCDCIHHLGEASIKLLQGAYPNIKAQHVVIAHHVYDELYNLNITKEEARKRLHIPQNKKCILSFGSFRDDEERNIVINLKKQLGSHDYYYLMPGFYVARIRSKNIRRSLTVLQRTIRYTLLAKFNGIHISHEYIPDDMVPYYLAAADVMLIQRTKILNSGNVPLAMLAGLPIVGPDDGNVGRILKSTGNYLFDSNNLSTVPVAITNALNDATLGLSNERYALQNLTTRSVVEQLIKLYSSFMDC